MRRIIRYLLMEKTLHTPAPGECMILVDFTWLLYDRFWSVICIPWGRQVHFEDITQEESVKLRKNKTPGHCKVYMVIILYRITSFGIWTPLKLVAMWLILIKRLCASYCSAVSVSPPAPSGWCWLRRKCHRSGGRWDVEHRRCHTILPQASTYREKHKRNISKQMNSIVMCSLNRNDFWAPKMGHRTKYRAPESSSSI